MVVRGEAAKYRARPHARTDVVADGEVLRGTKGPRTAYHGLEKAFRAAKEARASPSENESGEPAESSGVDVVRCERGEGQAQLAVRSTTDGGSGKVVSGWVLAEEETRLVEVEAELAWKW
jgi:hypothetical protein